MCEAQRRDDAMIQPHRQAPVVKREPVSGSDLRTIAEAPKPILAQLGLRGSQRVSPARDFWAGAGRIRLAT
jgi:hypothetical protein